MPEQERLDDAIGILRNQAEVVVPSFIFLDFRLLSRD